MKLITALLTATLAAVASAAVIDMRAASNCTAFNSTDSGYVCLDRPYDCTSTYLVQPGDTCQGIAASFNNFTLSVLNYWNPDIGRDCLSIKAYAPICINTPWYTFKPPVQAASGTVVDVTRVAAYEQPNPLIPSTASNCTKYEYAGAGITLDELVANANITADDFVKWNPHVESKDAPVIWAQSWYAVKC